MSNVIEKVTTYLNEVVKSDADFEVTCWRDGADRTDGKVFSPAALASAFSLSTL